ncbi:MAG TPA: NYN domain-containing protein [Candidatus Omnitrophota bacterium]|nr:NYN domain-containing protein [Candidatus Omnitrophota bacterium]HPN87767.1 NYN domain-containing protein [Candidatus Omnitrophota bacterium]
MSVHFLLDGYNIIHQMPFKNLDSLEDQRNRLIRFIENQRPHGSRNNKITVIFDGQEGFLNYQKSVIVDILFSCSSSADEKIKQMVREAVHKKNMVVVTDDREIQIYVRALGAQVVGVNDFLTRSSDAKNIKQIARADKDSAKNISKTLEYQINEEMKQIWLKKNP